MNNGYKIVGRAKQKQRQTQTKTQTAATVASQITQECYTAHMSMGNMGSKTRVKKGGRKRRKGRGRGDT